MRPWRVILKISLLAAVVAVPLLAAPPLPPVKFTETKLDNGLRVIIAEDHDAPVYSIAVTYDVGSRDERAGRTGFAHLFEHMMFKGSDKVGPGEHFYLIFNNGGNMNGTTNADRTNYFETLPKNQLDLGLFLESDRMRSLAITKENLDNQRNAVQEERRLSYDNRPYGGTQEKQLELVYDAFPYKHSTIGSMTDLNAATVDDVKDFFRTYYAPNNAVVAIVGDVNTAETLAKVKKYFGDIPKQPAAKPVDFTEPPRTEERRAEIADKLARIPQLLISYKLPEGNSPDAVAAGMLNTILSSGESSRLYQKLVKEKELAAQVGGYVDARRGPSTLNIIAMVRPGKDPKEVEAIIDEEVARLHSEPVTANELLRARNTALRNATQARESSLSRAITLAGDAAIFKDPNRINTLLERQLSVSAADIEKVAKEYLKQNNRVVITTVPAAQKPAPVKQAEKD